MTCDQSVLDAFAADVVRDLDGTPKRLQARYFYDALGSALFDAICRLPWYRITRGEARLLRQHAAEIAGAALSQARQLAMVELGCGSGEKIETLVDAVPVHAAADVHLIDISHDALEATAARLSRFPHVRTSAHCGTYEEGLAAAGAALQQRAALALFLGSNIGNFDPGEAKTLLKAVREPMRPGAFFLLGADLVKPERDLLLAYDDPLGVTAAFNRNLLVRINRELEGDFDLDGFDHRALWNAAEQRVEMHLVSRRAQDVFLNAAGARVRFAAGETIWTESSYKYTEDGIVELGVSCGFSMTRQWIDPEARFALTLFNAI